MNRDANESTQIVPLTQPSLRSVPSTVVESHRLHVGSMPFPAWTTATEWLDLAKKSAYHSVRSVSLDRHDIDRTLYEAVLATEASGADQSGISSVNAEQVAVSSGASLHTVLLIRAGLFHCGLLSKVYPRSNLIQLQLPRDLDRRALPSPERGKA